MLQQWIVGAIVAYAFWAVARRYLPRSVRRLLRSWAVRLARRIGWTRLAAKLEERAEAGASCADGCDSCGKCGPSDKSGNGVEGGSGEPKQFTVSVEALRSTAARIR